MSEKTPERDKGNSFLRVFQIMEEIATADRPLTIAEISMATGLHGPTTHRLCKMLLQERFLQYEIDGKRLLGGPRLIAFSGCVLSGSHLGLERRVILEALVEDVGETCNISIPEGTQMVYAERVESHWPLRMQLPVGTPVPLHCTASGKLYLSRLAPAQRRGVLARLPLSRQTPYSITDVDSLAADLERIGETGFATDNEEFIEGLVAVAVPICGQDGAFCAGLALHAPKFRMTMEQAMEKLPALRTAARQIGDLLTNGVP